MITAVLGTALHVVLAVSGRSLDLALGTGCGRFMLACLRGFVSRRLTLYRSQSSGDM